jgi:16S rRNA (adenine1518-N6/adenine1519-N6)-dimethyltransferase
MIDHRAKKSLGQNFLIDQNVLHKIVSALQLGADDVVIEIGPGTGLMTALIQPNVAHLLAVEIDSHLVSSLREKFASCTNLDIRQSDILKTDLQEWIGQRRARIVGNIPYYITTPIIFHVLDRPQHIQDMTLLMQKEVAERIVARPNSKAYGILSVISQACADVHILMQVPATVFHPRPKVDSALVRWSFTTRLDEKIADHDLFRRVVRTAFNQRRKMLRATLKSFPMASLQGWDFTKRPEDLSVEEWIELTNDIKKVMG